MTIAATGLVAWVFLFPTGNTISSMGVTFGGCSDECSSERAQEAAEEEVKDLRSTSSAALILDTRTFLASSLSTAGRSGATTTRCGWTLMRKMRNRKKDLFEYGKCDDIGRPGTDSKLYYINSWAMCWQSDHPNQQLFRRSPLLAEVCINTCRCSKFAH